MAPATHGLLGRILRANDDASRRFGPNTAEVEAFIHAVAHLTPWQWRQVIAARSLVSTVTKEDAALPSDVVKAIQAAIRSTDGRLAEPMLRAGEALLQAMEKRTDEKLVAAWQATSALVMRHRTSPLKFAAHYAPFVALIPVSGFDALDPTMTRYLHAVQSLSREKCDQLAKRWRLEPDASRALLQAVAKSRYLKSEEAAALIALRTIPPHLAGDAGWGAVRTVAHGGRVLGSRPELTAEQVAVLWAPLEAAIPLASVEEPPPKPARARVRAAVARATTAIKAPAAARSGTASVPKRLAVAQPKAPAPYGQNSPEVAAFIKGIAELTPIQWLRILDRRQLVASVTREGNAEPAGAVRALLAGIKGTGSLDTNTRCRAFAAVEHAAHAFEAKVRAGGGGDVAEYYGAFAGIVPLGYIAEDGFAKLVGALSPPDWIQVANSVPAVNEDVVAPLINAGGALHDFLAGRSDDEAVAAWLALTALVRRQQLAPIKFAASYAPFASAIPVTNPRSLGAPVLRYVSALGRLSAAQCKLLAQPWQADDDASGALSRAVADGGAKEAEEASALVAVVTVPMRLSGGDGWAAAKTAAYGGRVIGARARLSLEQIEALWEPIQQAIPLASLGAVARSSRRLS
ncbi:MAG TPA: hypothetical protein VGK42_12505 [Candidatus Dormibacteraeota bacterium]|jgi:hypothetical protein